MASVTCRMNTRIRYNLSATSETLRKQIFSDKLSSLATMQASITLKKFFYVIFHGYSLLQSHALRYFFSSE